MNIVIGCLLPAINAQIDSPAPLQLAPIAPGPFAGTLESLKQNRYPKWFTDGKLGIWAHWGPQSVPMEGDWYARLEYLQGEKDYNDHLEKYGHPSKTGWKDVIPLWHAEKWDPDRLMALYKKAGAKYFVSMGCHHDNFDLWNSTYHRWNAVKMGPHKDVVGTWQKAAKKLGLHFGVSEHMGASFTWFQVAHGADKTGPLAGVPYDGNDPTFWDLYHQPAQPGDNGWYSTDPRWHAEWYRRIKDLIDNYHPDLLYSDGGIPFGDVGSQLVSHLYNDSLANHGGHQEVVYTCKQPSLGRWVQDVERGVMAGIQPYPWQTDTSIGDWFYNKHWKYRDAAWVIHTLVDVVSKNGNLLINVVQRPDGSLDPEAEQVLADMAAWMSVNRESIYGTQPWLTSGEGPTQAKGGAFKEDFGYTGQDVRFAQKGGNVYATLMGWPSAREVVLTSFARTPETKAQITGVRLLGAKMPVQWDWRADGLHVTMPDAKISDIGVVLKVSGRNMRAFVLPEVVTNTKVVEPDAAGRFALKPDAADAHGGQVQVETNDGQPNLGYWDNADDWISWTIDSPGAGTYQVTATVSAGNGATAFDMSAGGKRTLVQIPATESWLAYREITLGTLEVAKSGKVEIALRPHDKSHWRPMNIREIRMQRGPL